MRSMQNIEIEFTKSSHNPSSVYLLQIASMIIFQLIIEGFWSEVAKIKNILTKNWLIANNCLK